MRLHTHFSNLSHVWGWQEMVRSLRTYMCWPILCLMQSHQALMLFSKHGGNEIISLVFCLIQQSWKCTLHKYVPLLWEEYYFFLIHIYGKINLGTALCLQIFISLYTGSWVHLSQLVWNIIGSDPIARTKFIMSPLERSIKVFICFTMSLPDQTHLNLKFSNSEDWHDDGKQLVKGPKMPYALSCNYRQFSKTIQMD